ncbi:MAG: hypothetical protein WEB06_19580 [Actinomycetota bacterium]
MDERIYICEACRQRVDPANPDVVRAIEQVDVTGFGEERTFIDGYGVYFHADHFPATGYRKAAK